MIIMDKDLTMETPPVPTLLGYATIHTTTFPHRRGQEAMKRAVAPVQAVLRRFYRGAAERPALRHRSLWTRNTICRDVVHYAPVPIIPCGYGVTSSVKASSQTSCRLPQ